MDSSRDPLNVGQDQQHLPARRFHLVIGRVAVESGWAVAEKR